MMKRHVIAPFISFLLSWGLCLYGILQISELWTIFWKSARNFEFY